MNRFDFEHDLKQEIHTQFDDYGVRIPIRSKLSDMLLDYLTIMKKIVIPKSRNVIISPLLKNKLKSHPKENEIKLLESLFKQGKDVNYFQSKRLFQTKFHDHLLYEWNIYHFHLGNTTEKNSKFIKQTDIMLFVYVTDETVVFLDTEKHAEGIFGDEKWLEILHDYYPELIEIYLDDTIKDVSPKLDSISRQTLWNKGYLIGMTKIRDKVYHSPGIGRSTSGHSVIVVKTSNEIIRWIHQLKKQFESKSNLICSAFGLKENDAFFRLVFGRETLEVIDNKSKLSILTYPNLFEFKN